MRKVRIRGSYGKIVMDKKKKSKCVVCGKVIYGKGTCSWKCWKKLQGGKND